MRDRWTKMVETELRVYLCRDLHVKDIQRKLDEMDQDIWIAASNVTDMPRGSSTERYSSVEIQVEYRDESRVRYRHMLSDLHKRIRRIGDALHSLPPHSQHVIRLCYFSVQFMSDADIADHLGLSVNELEDIKNEAIGILYDKLQPAVMHQTA